MQGSLIARLTWFYSCYCTPLVTDTYSIHVRVQVLAGVTDCPVFMVLCMMYTCAPHGCELNRLPHARATNMTLTKGSQFPCLTPLVGHGPPENCTTIRWSGYFTKHNLGASRSCFEPPWCPSRNLWLQVSFALLAVAVGRWPRVLKYW